MNYYTIPPPEALAGYVQFFWVLEETVSHNECFAHRTLPDGCAELIFYCQGGFQIFDDKTLIGNTFLSGLFGQSKNYKQFVTHKDFGLFGCYLYPYAIPALFAMPAAEVTDKAYPLEILWGREGKALEDKVMCASGSRQRVGLVSEFLLRRIKTRDRDMAIEMCIRQIVDHPKQIFIDLLADQCHLSRRQFERRFRELAGFSPALFHTIIRFNKVAKTVPDQNLSLTQLALDNGYYDQSHFIHDFHKFSGYNPREYFNLRMDEPDYRTIRDARPENVAILQSETGDNLFF